ncbi:competence type IV pilus minor pilin ComGF [Gracilibacillus ureilyticus]|nr:ComGF family competence protein [Gracilibacillus ureilyticus]
MLKQIPKQFVFTVTNRKDAGFTLISLIVTMAIIMTVLLFSAQLLHTALLQDRSSDFKTLQFFHFLEEELFMASQYYIDNNKLVFITDSDEKVTYSQYNDVIRRQVNGRGHEIILRNVEKVLMNRLEGEKLLLIVETEGGQRFEKILAAI